MEDAQMGWYSSRGGLSRDVPVKNDAGKKVTVPPPSQPKDAAEVFIDLRTKTKIPPALQ